MKVSSAEEAWHNGLREIVDNHDPVQCIRHYGRELLEAAAEVAEAAEDHSYAIGITGAIAAEIRKLKEEL